MRGFFGHTHHEHDFAGRGRGRRGGWLHHFGGDGPHGHGHGDDMRAARLMSSADLQLVLLALIGDAPRHGYELIKAVDEASGGFYSPSPGVIYPALTYLEELGYTAADAEGNRKRHRLTEQGVKHLADNRAAADALLTQLAAAGRHATEVREWFDRAPGSWSRELHREFHELRGELKAALMEKRHAAPEEQKRVLEVIRQAIRDIRKG